MNKKLFSGPLPFLKPGVLVGGLIPLVAILWQLYRGELGANPIAEILNELGLLALIFLIAALVPTVLKLLFDWTWPVRIRRMLGLFGFFYAALHFTTYAVADQVLNFRAIIQDVLKRNFIAVGFIAFLSLIPLAITSTDQWVRRLKYARWKQLHRLSYLAAVLGVIHFIWRVKKDLSEPVKYAIVLAALLGVRLFYALKRRRR